MLDEAIPASSVDLIFADPPYNIGKDFEGFRDKWKSEEEYMDWCYRWLALCLDKLKPAGSMYLMASTQCMPYFDIYLRERLCILSRIIWHYDSSGVQAKITMVPSTSQFYFVSKTKNITLLMAMTS